LGTTFSIDCKVKYHKMKVRPFIRLSMPEWYFKAGIERLAGKAQTPAAGYECGEAAVGLPEARSFAIM